MAFRNSVPTSDSVPPLHINPQLDDITLLRSRHSQFIRRMSRMWLNATSEDGGIKGSAISPVSRAAGGAETVEGGVSRKALETLSKVSLIVVMAARNLHQF